jgi:hypothetical protein
MSKVHSLGWTMARAQVLTFNALSGLDFINNLGAGGFD